jgi:microcystin-dependent protein
MPRSSTGTYSQPAGTSAVSGAVIDPVAYNTLQSDYGSEVTNSLDRLGRGGMQANLNMGSFKVVSAADGTASTDLATKGQMDTATALLVPKAGGTMTGDLVLYGSAPATSASAAPKSYIDALLLAGLPPGVIFPYASSATPVGFLECNGAAVSRTTYAALFAAIGTTFGSGDGSTTFNVPDLRGEFMRFYDHGRGVDSGRVFGSAQSDATKDHTHNETGGGSFRVTRNGGSSEYSTLAGTQIITSASTTGTITGGGGTETRPRNVALLAIIKY